MNEGFNYEQSEKEAVSCNICGNNSSALLARKSKNGLPVSTVMCNKCGLVYISPRMTRRSYDDYYKFHYRNDRDAIKGSSKETDLDRNFEYARKFGNALAKRTQEFFEPGITLDVGSSTGGVLFGLREIIGGIIPQGIEPSVSESEYANKKGIPTETAIFEDWKGKDFPVKASNILCVQSLNHLLDPKGFLEWSHEVLRPGGHIILAVKNFRHQIRRAGTIEAGVQIDHPYMFTPETLKYMLECSGFRTVYFDVDEGKTLKEREKQREEGLSVHHIRIVGRKIDRSDIPVQPPSLLKARLSYNRLLLKIYYVTRYSRHLAFLRKMLHI